MVSPKRFLLALLYTSATVMVVSSEQTPLQVSEVDNTENTFSNHTDMIEAMGIPSEGVWCQDQKFTAAEINYALVASRYCLSGQTACACRSQGRRYPHTYHDSEHWFPPTPFQPYEMVLQRWEPYCDEAPDKYRVVLDPVSGAYVGAIVHTGHGNAFTCCYNLRGNGDVDCSCIRRQNGECP